MNEENGRWITMNGKHIFIKNGQSPMDAFIKQKGGDKIYKIPKEQLKKFSNRQDGNYYVAEINPNDFLNLTANEEVVNIINQEIKNDKLDINKINESYMQLMVDLETGQVETHEGRHRMARLRNNGYNVAEIIIISKNNQYNEFYGHDIGSLHLKSQDGKLRTATITNLKILNKQGSEKS